MVDDLPDAARRAFERHDAFEPVDGGFECTTTAFEATATALLPTDGEFRFEVVVTLPTLDAATVDEVADVVEDGWFDTLQLRLEDAYDVAEVEPAAGPSIERGDERIAATFRYLTGSAGSGVDAAKAIVDYAEGTYVQGVVPGYEYRDPVAGLLARASEHGGADDEGARHGGTPL